MLTVHALSRLFNPFTDFDVVLSGEGLLPPTQGSRKFGGRDRLFRRRLLLQPGQRLAVQAAMFGPGTLFQRLMDFSRAPADRQWCRLCLHGAEKYINRKQSESILTEIRCVTPILTEANS